MRPDLPARCALHWTVKYLTFTIPCARPLSLGSRSRVSALRLPLFEFCSAAFRLSASATELAPSDFPPCGFRSSGDSIWLAFCDANRTASGLLPAGLLRDPHPLELRFRTLRLAASSPPATICPLTLPGFGPFNARAQTNCASHTTAEAWSFAFQSRGPLTVKLAAPSQLIRKVLPIFSFRWSLPPYFHNNLKVYDSSRRDLMNS